MDELTGWNRWFPNRTGSVLRGPGVPRLNPGGGEYVRLTTSAPALELQPDPIADLVANLVRRFDPGGYQLQCPVAGCTWHLLVPRMELDPLELLDGDQYVTHVEGVPREDVELVLSAHVHWHAALTETDVRDAPLPRESCWCSPIPRGPGCIACEPAR